MALNDNVSAASDGGSKADQNKPRPDLLNWALVRAMPGLVNTVAYQRFEGELRDALANDLSRLELWSQAQIPDPVIFDLFVRAIYLCGDDVANVSFPEADQRETCALGLMEVSKVLAFGATKYAPRNWEKGIHYSRVVAAALRHGLAYFSGEETDPETGLTHLAHYGCCLMFLASFVMRGQGAKWDDRRESHTP